MQYEYFGHQGQRRSETQDDAKSSKAIGDRIVSGFDVTSRFVVTRNGEGLSIVYFQSDITGKVWALYF